MNLLSYGPASFNGMTASTTDDGLLHVEGTSQVAHRGIQWNLPILDAVQEKTLTFTAYSTPKGCYSYVHIVGEDSSDLGNITTGQSIRIPAEATALQLRVAASSAGVTISGDYKIQLEIGTSATEWTKPDDTDNRGGGYELVNLWPTIAAETKNGLSLTGNGDGTYTVDGEYQSWTTFEAKVTLAAGEYSIAASEGLTSLSSWDLLLQVTPTEASSSSIIKPGTPTATLEAGRYRCQINVNAALSGARTIRPVLNRIG